MEAVELEQIGKIPTGQDLVDFHRATWRDFFGKEVKVNSSVSHLREGLVRVRDIGWDSFRAHLIPLLTRAEFGPTSQYPDLKTPLGRFYWDNIANGNIKDVRRFGGYGVLVDTSVMPNYNGGRQQVTDEPFSRINARLRVEGKIEVPGNLDHVPPTSRFGISWDELRRAVYPTIARPLGVNERGVRNLTPEEFSLLGNAFYQHFGEADIWIWLENKFEGDGRLIGGNSGVGGLGSVYYDWSDYLGGRVAFRPVIAFTP